MAEIGVVTIHGMGKTKKSYANSLQEKLQSKLKDKWSQISFQTVYYQDILQPFQEEVFNSMRPYISWMRLREFLLFGFSDAASLESSKRGDARVYEKSQEIIIQTLKKVYLDLNKTNKKVFIVAHSLGSQVISNYIWDAQKYEEKKIGIWNNIDNYTTNFQEKKFLKLESLHRLFTTGCSIPIFVAGYEREEIIPITKPNNEFKWLNFYDEDDVLGWPLQPLNDAYKNLVEDIPINAGQGLAGLWKSWTPFAHTEYWNDDQFLNQVVYEIREVL